MPAENPCRSRPINTSSGASKPIVAYPGVHAIEKMPTDMRVRVRMRPARRPWLSVYAPRTVAEGGRIRNPAPNVISDNMSDRKGLPLGKKALPMAVGIFSIACTPGYATIGLLAPLLVLIGRLLQGFSAG